MSLQGHPQFALVPVAYVWPAMHLAGPMLHVLRHLLIPQPGKTADLCKVMMGTPSQLCTVSHPPTRYAEVQIKSS